MVRSELAFQQTQLAKRRASGLLSCGDVVRATTELRRAHALASEASRANPDDVSLQEECDVISGLIDEAQLGNVGRAAKLSSADVSRKSRTRVAVPRDNPRFAQRRHAAPVSPGPCAGRTPPTIASTHGGTMPIYPHQLKLGKPYTPDAGTAERTASAAPEQVQDLTSLDGAEPWRQRYVRVRLTEPERVDTALALLDAPLDIVREP